MILKGKNIVLRKLRPDDADSLVKYGDNPKIARNLRNVFPSPYTLEAANDWIKTSTTEDHFAHSFAITQNDECLGMAGLHPKGDVYSKTHELGYWIGEPFWGQGLVSEAVALLADFGLNILGAARIEAYVYEWNPASARVLEKNGFALEGRLRKSIYKEGQLIDQFIFAKVQE
jgi:ribosomal-protein-alanine N-acetyltransferase